MKLDCDCIRDILLTVEEYDGFRTFDKIPLTDKYSEKTLCYHIQQCKDANLLSNVRKYVDGGYAVFSLTPKGHETINKIHNDTKWNKIKKQIGPTISTILSILQLIDS